MMNMFDLISAHRKLFGTSIDNTQYSRFSLLQTPRNHTWYESFAPGDNVGVLKQDGKYYVEKYHPGCVGKGIVIANSMDFEYAVLWVSSDE